MSVVTNWLVKKRCLSRYILLPNVFDHNLSILAPVRSLICPPRFTRASDRSVTNLHSAQLVARVAPRHCPSLQCRRNSISAGPRRPSWPGESAEAAQERAQWVRWFDGRTFSKDAISSTFTRSSGPGGQNVNKLSTKAVVRLDLSHAGATGSSGWNRCGAASNDDDVGDTAGEISDQRAWLLASVLGRLVSTSQYYVASSHSLLVTSMASRSREANHEDAKQKLHAHILAVASTSLPSLDDDSDAARTQSDKVIRLARKEGAKMRRVKERRGGVKTGRKAGRGGGVWD